MPQLVQVHESLQTERKTNNRERERKDERVRTKTLGQCNPADDLHRIQAVAGQVRMLCSPDALSRLPAFADPVAALTIGTVE